jgi:predicted hydrocarbon binding protein
MACLSVADRNQRHLVSETRGWVEVQAAEGFSCGRRNNEALRCWGKPFRKVPLPEKKIDVQLWAIGGTGLCWVSERDLHCEGRFLDGQVLDPWDEAWGLEEIPFDPSDIAVTADHACAVGPDLGVPVCWGPSAPDPEALEEALGQDDWTEVEVSGDYGCALSEAGRMGCWGTSMRVLEDEDAPITQLKVGPSGLVCVLADGLEGIGLRCWDLDNGDSVSEPQVGGDVPGDYLVGDGFSCAITEADQDGRRDGVDLEVDCAFEDEVGERPAALADIPRDLPLVSLDAGRFHACGLLEDGRAACWGRGRSDPAISELFPP